MKPILFKTEMVRAILDGQKTVTRRVVKPQPLSKLAYVCMGHGHGKWGYPGADAWKYWEDESFRLPDGLSGEEKNRRWTPPCHTGDILYVRETWAGAAFFAMENDYLYKSTDEEMLNINGFEVKWHPSIHMPREAARIFLRVTGIRVERLQEITAEQIIKEGISREPLDEVGEDFFKGMFSDLWDSPIKPKDHALYGWDANPWVWVIEFERVEKPESEEDNDRA